MGIKTGLKTIVLKSALKKRRGKNSFDEAESELYKLPADAAEDMNNSYYFTAHSENGEAMFFRYAERGGGKNAIAEVWFAYRAADGTAYVNEKRLLKLSESTARVECIEPLKKWNFSFKGKLTPVKPDGDLIARTSGEALDGEFSGVFTGEYGLYNFSRDTDLKTYCSALAAEKWYKGFSKELEHIDQVHIEQDGSISGTLDVKGKKYKINAEAIRDHSYGRRKWSFFNRHTWLIGILEDGTRLNVNAVRYPILNVRGLKTGYKIKDGFKAGTTKVSFSDELGLSGGPYKEGSYKACYSDKSALDCSFKLDIAFPFEFSDKDGSYIIYEGVSGFTCGNLKGRGITEFGYNKDKSRYQNSGLVG